MAKFIHIEEMRAFQRGQKEEAEQAVNLNCGRKEGNRSFGHDEKRGGSRRQDFLREPEYVNYTPLNAPSKGARKSIAGRSVTRKVTTKSSIC